MKTIGYPFAALVGQEKMKLALILAAIQPRLGGVVLRGEKGTAKSTAARALAPLLGENAPFKTLPLNATEDRLVGGIDLEKSISQGKAVFAPGLLAEVDKGVLYIDEINLLPDHLVDLLLDVSSSGVNIVEREGIATSHPSRFVMIGSMNPEEGALRPGLIDRFGLCVDVNAQSDIDQRVELMKRRLSYDRDPVTIQRQWASQEAELARRLAHARETVDSVQLPQTAVVTISQLVTEANVAGHRADLILADAARAHAVWQGRGHVETSDIAAVAELVLAHRRREALPPPPASAEPQNNNESPKETEPPPDETSPLDTETDTGEKPDQTVEPDSQSSQDQNQSGEGGENNQNPLVGSQGTGQVDYDDTDPGQTSGAAQPITTPSEPFKVRPLEPVEDHLARVGSGRRMRTRSADRRGRYVRPRPARDSTEVQDLALDATVRAAAPYQLSRLANWNRNHVEPPPALLLNPIDYHTKIRERRTGSCIVLVVDASGSMGARGRMAASKGAVLSLLLDAYQKRDKVAMVSFRRRKAEVLLPPTSSIERASELLATLPIGGRTPLSAGLVEAYSIIATELRRNPSLRPLAVLITDGRANQPLNPDSTSAWDEALTIASKLGADSRIRWVVVDTESAQGIRLKLAPQLSQRLQAPCYTIDDLRVDDLVGLVKGHRS